MREPFLHALILTDAVSILFFTGVNVHFVDLFQTQCTVQGGGGGADDVDVERPSRGATGGRIEA